MAKRIKSGSRDVKPVFRIYTEGQESEINYIRNYIEGYLEKHGIFNKIITAEKPVCHNPYGLLTTAKSKPEYVAGDIVWLVFDCDGHAKKPGTFEEAKQTGIKIAYSSICFETWILLHFCYTTRSYPKCENLISDPNYFNKYIKEYDKAKTDLFNVANSGYDGKGLINAVKNAKKLCKAMITAHPGKKIYEINPYTNVHELLIAINKYLKISSKTAGF